MRDKREIGFDILDNANLEEIEELAMDSNMLDDETKKRIKSIIDKKCKEANGEIILDENKSVNNINHENTVSHVEIYKERKIKKIISAVVSVAAVFGIVASGAALIRNNKIKTEDITKSSSNIHSADPDEYEAAAQNVFNNIFQINPLPELKYDYIDIAGDATPELFVNYKNGGLLDYYAIYEYNGNEYDELSAGYYHRLMISYDNNSLAVMSDEASSNIVLYDFEPDKEKVLSASEDNQNIFNCYQEHKETSCKVYENDCFVVEYRTTQWVYVNGYERVDKYDIFYLESPIRCKKEISEEEYNQIMDRYDAYGWTELKIDKYTIKAEKTTPEDALASVISSHRMISDEYSYKYSYKLANFTGDSNPELFLLIESEGFRGDELYYGEFNGYFYKMESILSSDADRIMISEKNKSIAFIFDGYRDYYDDYAVELFDFAPDETKIKDGGEIIFNKYEELGKTFMCHNIWNADGEVEPKVWYASEFPPDNPDGSISFRCMDDSSYSKDLFIEKMNEYDSYGWSEMKFIQYDIESEIKYDDTKDIYISAAMRIINWNYGYDISGYDLVDLNNDAVPELIIKHADQISGTMVDVFTYGADGYYDGFGISQSECNDVMYCTEKNMIIFIHGKYNSYTTIYKVHKYKDFELIEYYPKSDEEICKEMSSYDWHSFNFK